MTPPRTPQIKVGLDFGTGVQRVGGLAMRGRRVYFEYDRDFITKGMDISPLRLPLRAGVQSFDDTLFEGLPGVLNDSLPDGWGRLLFDRLMRTQGILPAEITPLDRLAHVGVHGLGALVFEPDHSTEQRGDDISLDRLNAQAQAVLDGRLEDTLSRLIALNGSSAGARPKALISVNDSRDHLIHGTLPRDNTPWPQGYTPWIVKFPNSHDGLDAGAIEYVYALMAKDAGLSMPDVHLFPARKGAGYFAIKRFDRVGSKRYHMHTACGLLHSDFRTPSLDYEDLIALTGHVTRDMREVEKLYRLAVFNVLAHNRDDHSKNFSYLMDSTGNWTLSPAYDLTFSSGPGGEHSTLVMGKGRSPGTAQLLTLAEEAKIKKTRALEIIDTTTASLSNWPALAKQYGISHTNSQFIKQKMDQLRTT